MFDRFRQLPLWQQWLWVTAAGGATLDLLLQVGGLESATGMAFLAVSAGQWALLRGRVRGASWWVVVSPVFGFLGVAMGGYFGGELQDAIDGVSNSPVGIAYDEGPGRSYIGRYGAEALAGVLTGATLGFGQWLVLRRAFPRAGGWVPANIVAFLIGFLLEAHMPVVGVITGLALRLLWKTTYPETIATTARVPRVTVGWGFYLRWVWLTALSFGVGSAVSNAIAHPIPESLQSVRNVIGWFADGACVGAAQWVLLRREVAAAWRWVVASALGWVVGLSLFAEGSRVLNALLAGVLAAAGVVHAGNLKKFPFEIFDLPFGGAVAGAAIGVLQWLLLRRNVTAAGWWVLASAIGWAVAYIAPWMGTASVGPATALGMITGSLTGALLVWLLRRRRKSAQE